METIHFKTVDPVSQDLLRAAAQQGIGLNWERYEKQQPQDGFLRLGLSCPYGCMQGPCRIDPFGRGAQNGICGLDRDGMVAASLLRLSLQGALETMALHPDLSCTDFAWPAALASKTASLLGGAGSRPLSFTDILESIRLLNRPSASPATLVRQALRLGLLAVGLRAQAIPQTAAKAVRVGYGLLAAQTVRIGITGRVPQSTLEAFRQEAAGAGISGIEFVSLGEWIPAEAGFVPIACTSGETETVLSSGVLDLLIAGPGTDAGILALCGKIKLSVFSVENGSASADILQRARTAFDRRLPGSFAPDASLVAAGQVPFGANDILSALKNGSPAKVALVGGADTLQQSLGHLPTELAKALRGAELAVASWGDAALWMMKEELPVAVLEAESGPLAAVLALAEAGRLPSVAGICFTGLRNNRDFNLVLGLAALGMKVLVATPLPLWGSEKVRTLLGEKLASAGGLLAHFDHPVRPDEIMDWFLRS